MGLALVGWAACRPSTALAPPWRLTGRLVPVLLIASVVPDLDVILAATLPGGMGWHHGPTHSLPGAAALGWGVARIGRLGRGDTALAILVAVSHVALDWSTGAAGAPVEFGVPLIWPVSSQRYMDAHPWFGAFGIDKPGFLRHMFARDAWPVYGHEVGTVAVAALTAWPIRVLLRRIRIRGP